jgi:hypothetical protein
MKLRIFFLISNGFFMVLVHLGITQDFCTFISSGLQIHHGNDTNIRTPKNKKLENE